MLFSFILNGKQIEVNSEPHRRLSSLLIDVLKIKSLQTNCQSGYCGSCLVLLKGKLVSSCLVMVAQIVQSEIRTIENFENSHELELLSKAYRNTSANICSYCAAAKSLSILSLFEKTLTPSSEDIGHITPIVQCKCNSEEQLKEIINEYSKLMRDYHAKSIHS